MYIKFHQLENHATRDPKTYMLNGDDHCYTEIFDKRQPWRKNKSPSYSSCHNQQRSDLSFSGGGDDEGSAAANSVMHVSADGDCGKQTHQSQMPLYSHLEGTGSSVGTAEGSAGARLVSRIISWSSFIPSDQSQLCGPGDWVVVRHQQI
ncbi:hypothetical protein Tco_0615348 [Tanacetum coccineum]